MNKPNDSVRVVIFDGQDKSRFLILTETDAPDDWKLPGGKFDSDDETPDHATNRELMEELQIDSVSIGLVLKGELKNDDGKSERYIYFAICEPKRIKPSNEIAKTRWVTVGNVPDCKNKNHILSAVRCVLEA